MFALISQYIFARKTKVFLKIKKIQILGALILKRQKDRKTEKQKNRKTERQKDRKIEKHKDKKTAERQKDRKTEGPSPILVNISVR